MAALDTHKAFRTLTDAGFPEGQAEALVETIGMGSDALATKADVAAIHEEMATKTDVAAIRKEMATQSALQDVQLQLERRLTSLVLQMVILQVMVGGLIVALVKLLP